jgi:hypothetical protein
MLEAAGMKDAHYVSSRAQVLATDSDGKTYASSYCYMFNPGSSNTYAFQQVTDNGDGTYSNVDGAYKKVTISSAALGMGSLKRNYSSLDLFLERPWDGKWEARFDYTWSKSHGNSEGPANSDTGQGSNAHDNGVATSQNFDAWQIMQYADGYLANDRKHQFKARLSYAITPEWLLSANVSIASGAPLSCFGYYNPDGSIDETSSEADPIGYGGSYHTCFGEAYRSGKARTPWTHRYDVAVTYRPAFLDKKLAVSMQVFNLFNEVVPTSYYSYSESDPYVVDNAYMLPQSYTSPRYVQLSARYDW